MTRKNTFHLSVSGIIINLVIAGLLMALISPALAGTSSTAPDFTSPEQPVGPFEDTAQSQIPDRDTGIDETAVADVLSPTGSGDRAWQFPVDTTTFKPDEYIVTADAVMEKATGTALFNVLDTSSSRQGRAPQKTEGSPSHPANGGYYITIDPISDRFVGEKFSITGRTNLPEAAEMLVQVYSSSFKPTQKSQSGEFSGATGTVRASDSSQPVPALAPMQKDPGVKGSDAKIIKTASVTLEVPDVASSVEAFQTLAISQGGYISSTTIQANGNRHTGTIVLRIPQAHFETSIAGVKSAGTVKSFASQGEDVTEEYIDLQARKKSYLVQLAQYYVLMKKAVKVSDIIAIQQQIDRVQTELNRLEGRLKYLESRVDLSTITISLQEPEPVLVHTEPGHNFVSAINKGIEGLFSLIDAIIITAITFLPAIVVACIGYGIYRWRKGKQPVMAAAEIPGGK
ncbi:MAG: DUF4349 domain-containing protein [Methanoregula sp.]|nr:DUF4349 domain-containing protein [Methanoregula sp.]